MSEVIARYLIYSLLLYKWMVYDWNKRSYTLSDGKRNSNVIYIYVRKQLFSTITREVFPRAYVNN